MKRLILTTLLLPFFSSAELTTDKFAPEAATGLEKKSLVTAKDMVAVTANPHATEAAYDMLTAGGSAIDAMIAAQLVLGLVEPQSSGLGGGAFLVYYNGPTQQLTTYDARETAPQAVTPKLFLDDKGKPLAFYDAVVGGRSVGTPGTVKLLWETHQKHGKLAWAKLFEPAKKLAKDGFLVSPRLAKLINNDQKKLSHDADSNAYFFDEKGAPLTTGTLLKNPAYYDTLSIIATQGAKGFYQGEISKEIIEKVQGHKTNPGVLAQKDFDLYQIKERAPVCAPYHSYKVCGMGPPSSGALTVGQILMLLEDAPLDTLGPDNVESWRLIGDASRLAFADRGRYMADEDYVPMPTEGLLEPGYIKQRAALILDKKNTLTKVEAGSPPWQYATQYADDASIELPSTSHLSIKDKEGNLVSMTTTIENGFGSRIMVKGFLLNNELTDFSFKTHNNGKPVANRIEPGKRPRSSMAPTIVLDKDNQPYMVIGSPGGSRIIGYVAKTIIGHLDWGLDIQQAISLPHLVNRFGTYDIEEGTKATALEKGLQEMGYKTKVKELNSGLHGFIITDKGLEAGADPRREGLALGN